ncbi:MAG: pyrophosphatase, partial [Polaromonas sp.]|nr:pyrophosphatase [Polaromonas sp.]
QQCAAKQWKSAILQGYFAFSRLKQNKGGIVSIDLDKQSLTYSPLEAAQS